MAGRRVRSKQKDAGKERVKQSGKRKDSRSKSDRKRDDGRVEIAQAETALAKALRKLGDAREKLIVRERELTRLLVKHGRMPETDMSAGADESLESVPLLDQMQVTTPSERGDGGGGVDDSEGVKSDRMEHSSTIVQLFDQKQVIR